MAETLHIDLDEFKTPWHWDTVSLFDYHNGEPKKWCDNQGWLTGVDYYVVLTDRHPAFTTEWGRFKISGNRVYNYLFKNPKHATMFRLRWSHGN